MDENIPVNTGNKQGKQANRTSFKPGQSGNPNGRPPGSRNWDTLLEEAITKVQKTKDDTVLEHFVKQAYTKPQVMIALVKKLVADKTSTEITTPEPVEIVIHRAKDES